MEKSLFFEDLKSAAADFLRDSEGNYLAPDDALRADLAGMRFFEEILWGVAAAGDPLFAKLRCDGVVHHQVMLPSDWLPGAKSVVSFFLPFSEATKNSNAVNGEAPSDEWLHSRIEGQMMLAALGEFIVSQLRDAGFAAAFPTTDKRFRLITPFVSNWSERHAAYICGLGTFGLSKGLITERGMAGRFGSVITDAEIAATERKYSSPFEYCTMCGACQYRCPAGAIDKSRGAALGKDQPLCASFLKEMTFPPHGAHGRIRYGCGKCQVKVPCESAVPQKISG